jgi:hypothetical protein
LETELFQAFDDGVRLVVVSMEGDLETLLEVVYSLAQRETCGRKKIAFKGKRTVVLINIY